MIVTISGLVDTREDAIMQEEEEQFQKRFVSILNQAEERPLLFMAKSKLHSQLIIPHCIFK